MNDKVRPLPNKERNDLNAALEGAQRALERFNEVADIMVRQRKVAYDAYIKQGFTPAQALELCKY